MAFDDTAVLDVAALDALVDELDRRGYRVLGPQVSGGAIVYDDLACAADLPGGWRDVQEAGTYRLERRGDDAIFGHAVGPHSWKRFLFPPRVQLWRATRTGGELEFEEPEAPERPLALIGVRACELHAIEIQDRVFLHGRHSERDYERRRAGAFIVAVNCSDPAPTCFCDSAGAGPAVEQGFDLALTELLGDGGHRFLVEVGSRLGAEVLAGLPTRPAETADVDAARAVTARAAKRIERRLPEGDLPALLERSLESPHWDDVASRCLTCANCTLVCPTCFCSSVEDTTDLAAGEAARTRVWDSCFSIDHSYIHGGPVRPAARSRYRQWLTHKFGTWPAQFGAHGCVGCGRCIAWCPVGIDVTRELAALRAGEEVPV